MVALYFRWIAQIIVLMLVLSCSPVHIYLPANNEPQKTPVTIVQESLTELTGISAYHPGIQHSDSFLITIVPGLDLAESGLAFSSLSGKQLTGNLDAVDQAYRFAKLVNQVLISGTTYENTGIQLSNLYPCILSLLPAKKKSLNGFVDLRLIKLTSPTYNDDFYLTTVTPSGNNLKSWSSYDKIFSRREFFINETVESATLSGVIRSHRFKASLVHLELLRHSMLDVLIIQSRNHEKIYKKCIPQMDRPLSIITGLIVAKDLEVIEYPATNTALIISNDKNSTQLQLADPVTSLGVKGPIIIGFIATLL